MGNDSSISIVVPSYNSRTTIIQCLNSLMNQSYQGAYDIIVVDSSEDGTDELIKSMFTEVKVIHFNKKTLPGPARNIGIQASRSDYIAFTDTDCIVDHCWLENIMNRMKSGIYEAVGGVIFNGTPESISGTLGYLNEFNPYLPGTKPGLVNNIGANNTCYKRHIFDKHQFGNYHFAGEDTILNWSFENEGGRLYLDPKIKITHLNRKGFMNVLKHQHKIGQGSGIARIVMKRDWFLVRNPILAITALPWVRLLKMYWRIFKCDKNLFYKNFFLLPLSFIVAYSWSLGFFQSLIKYSTHNVRSSS